MRAEFLANLLYSGMWAAQTLPSSARDSHEEKLLQKDNAETDLHRKPFPVRPIAILSSGMRVRLIAHFRGVLGLEPKVGPLHWM